LATAQKPFGGSLRERLRQLGASESKALIARNHSENQLEARKSKCVHDESAKHARGATLEKARHAALAQNLDGDAARSDFVVANLNARLDAIDGKDGEPGERAGNAAGGGHSEDVGETAVAEDVVAKLLHQSQIGGEIDRTVADFAKKLNLRAAKEAADAVAAENVADDIEGGSKLALSDIVHLSANLDDFKWHIEGQNRSTGAAPATATLLGVSRRAGASQGTRKSFNRIQS
jgi:hypothetical protein